MKNFNIFGFLCLIGLFACDPDVPTITGEEILSVGSPYLQILTPAVGFQAGEESYDLSYNIINSNNSVTINSVKAYRTFTNATTEEVSERLPFDAANSVVGSDQRTVITKTVTYDQLREDLGLPDDQLEIAIGSTWLIDFEGVRDDGSTFPLIGVIRVAVLSRFAGIYEVVQSEYIRARTGEAVEFFGGWDGTEIFIGSVDATTFSYNDRWGFFGWSGNHFTFSLDEVTNLLTVPLLDPAGQLANGNALFSGDKAVGCHTSPGTFVDSELGMNCDDTPPAIIPDDVDGHHEMILIYGYISANGPRQFYEILRKK